MTRNEQIDINLKVVSAYNDAADELVPVNLIGSTRLRSCKATVIETSNWVILRSYSTLVAAVHKETRIGYDWLRFVYGFSATSAQHIAKFFVDYGVRGVGGSGLEMRWYPC